MTTTFGGWSAVRFAGDGSVRVGDYDVPPRLRLQSRRVGDLELEVDYEVRDGQPCCSRLVIYAPDHGAGILQEHLKEIHVANLMRLAYRATALVPDDEESSSRLNDEDMRPHLGKIERSVDAARTQRRKVTPEFLRRVAEVYRTNPARPTTEVARQFDVAYSTAAGWVLRARRAGLLPATTPGRSS